MRQELDPLLAQERLRQRPSSRLRTRARQVTDQALALTVSLPEVDDAISSITTCKVLSLQVGYSMLFPPADAPVSSICKDG